MACTIENGRLTKVASLTDRARLSKIDLPMRALEASRSIVR